MFIFNPTFYVNKIFEVSLNFFIKNNIDAALLDIDDTLVINEFPIPPKKTLDWIENLKSSNIKMILVSNNFKKRVESFAKKVNLPYVHMGMKPLPFGIIKALKILDTTKEKSIIIGDQIFTDIVAANLLGIKSILTEPLSPSKTLTMKFKRFMESPIRKHLKIINQ